MCDLAKELYQIDGVAILDVVFDKNLVTLHGALEKERQPCFKCQSNDVIFIGKTTRTFHLPPTGANRANLNIITRRLKCKSCNTTWWPQMPFASGKQRMSASFVAHVLDLVRITTIKDVADHLGVGWDTVKDLHKSHLQVVYENIDIQDVKYISIDEISIRKGHEYMTIISDIRSGRVIFAIEGRAKDDILPLLKDLKKRQKVL